MEFFFSFNKLFFRIELLLITNENVFFVVEKRIQQIKT